MKKRIFLIVSFALLFSGAGLGYVRTHPLSRPPQTGVFVDQDQIKRFSTVIAQIKGLYVHTVDDEALFSSAIQGMLSGLDPHSSYLDKEALKNLYAQTDGKFAGIGVEIIQDKGLIKVVSPIDDTPAQKAGIKAGDYILAVDDEPLINVSAEEAVQKMRGKAGTILKLTVANPKDRQQRKLEITRAVIKIQSVKSRLYEGGLGYIRISHFQAQTHKQVKSAVKALEKQAENKLTGLVLDLRNNPGGILDVSAKVADLFLDKQKLAENKKIFFTKGRSADAGFVFLATRGDILYGAPLIILINSGSASGSEIVAGALKDHKRAIIMGQKSFGKGSVQAVLPIDENTAVKLTTSLYYTPSGRSIQAEGIEPDVVVDELKFQPLKEEVLFFWKIRERNLRGHLKNGESNNRLEEIDAEMIKKSAVDAVLASEDYQLYQALKMLKVLHLYQKRLGG